MNALSILSKTPLYTKEKVLINKEWQLLFAHKTVQNQTNSTIDAKIDANDIGNEDENEPKHESLIHWFNKSHLVNDLRTSILEIVPAKGFKPLGIFQDAYSE